MQTEIQSDGSQLVVDITEIRSHSSAIAKRAYTIFKRTESGAVGDTSLERSRRCCVIYLTRLSSQKEEIDDALFAYQTGCFPASCIHVVHFRFRRESKSLDRQR